MTRPGIFTREGVRRLLYDHRHRLAAALAAVAVFIVDRLTKEAVLGHFRSGPLSGPTGYFDDRIIPVWGDWLRIIYIVNDGALLGLMRDYPLLLNILSLGALAALFLYVWRVREETPSLFIGLGLVIGGAAGNLFDRFVYRGVTDWIDVKFLGLLGPDLLQRVQSMGGVWARLARQFNRWPTFNIADAAIVAGLILLMWQSFRHSAKEDGR